VRPESVANQHSWFLVSLFFVGFQAGSTSVGHVNHHVTRPSQTSEISCVFFAVFLCTINQPHLLVVNNTTHHHPMISSIVHTFHSRIAEAAFDAVDGTIDSVTITAVFSHCKPNPCGETIEEQRHSDNNFICSRGRNLRPLNNGFVSARWVSLHSGTDVSHDVISLM